MNAKPRILIFTGDGKGKTTAALGMAMRASGHDMRTLIVQFVKAAETGETESARRLGNMNVVQTGLGFVPKAGSERFQEHKDAAQKGLSLAREAGETGDYDIVVLDEICFAVAAKLLDEAEVIAVLRRCRPEVTLVLTGRDASDGLIAIADTVSEIRCVKHGYESGIAAQKGVEF